MAEYIKPKAFLKPSYKWVELALVISTWAFNHYSYTTYCRFYSFYLDLYHWYLTGSPRCFKRGKGK